jgi:thioredoxin reductase
MATREQIAKLQQRLETKADPKRKTWWESYMKAGDVRTRSTQQVTSAAGKGASAALPIREYLTRV